MGIRVEGCGRWVTFCPTFNFGCHASKVNCRRNPEGRSAVRKMFLELVILSLNPVFQLPHPLRGQGVSLPSRSYHQIACSTLIYTQSGVGKSSLINRVFRLENTVREPWSDFVFYTN
jgi:hypothetical protein